MTPINLQTLLRIWMQIIYTAGQCQRNYQYMGLNWMNNKELENWRDIPCILEVDLKYSKNLHDPHNDYPLAPENIKLPNSTVTKLIPNLGNKKKYIVHHETLKLYESLGLKVTRVRRGIKFYESRWLKSIYIKTLN